MSVFPQTNPVGTCKKVILLTGHYHASLRKAGFHWLAAAFQRQGWDTTFATVSFSPISSLSGDFRSRLIPPTEYNRIKQVEERFASFVWHTPFHPAHLRSGALNTFFSPVFASYGRLPLGALKPRLKDADLIIFESNASLLLARRVRGLNKRARLVYRMSDDLRMLRGHPVIYQAEQKSLPFFDLISVPSLHMYRSMRYYGKIAWHSHGIEKDLFDRSYPSPYPPGSKNAVFVGVSDLDDRCIDIAAEEFPEWQFHVIGPVRTATPRPNIHVYGEMPFVQTIPYIQHADMGLGTRCYLPGAEALSDNLKIVQYTYLGLPILAPNFLVNNLGSLVSYVPGDRESVRRAFAEAIVYDRNRIRKDCISSWDDLARLLAEFAPA